MPIKKMLLGLVISLVVISVLLAVTERPTNAQGAGESAVSAKLDEILSNQRSIMADLSAMKEELRIIKIRVTQSQ